MDSLKLSITDCTEWRCRSSDPGPVSEDTEPTFVDRIELGFISEIPPKPSPAPTQTRSAVLKEKTDFNLIPSANINKISVLLSASDGHSMKLLQRNQMKQLRHLGALCEQARELQLPVRCYLMCAFSSPFEGQTSAHNLTDLCAKLIRFGCEDVILVDNEGTCNTTELTAVLNVLSPQLPKARTGFYFSADNPETYALVQLTNKQGFNKFCATRNGGFLIGSETHSSLNIRDLLLYLEHETRST